MDSIDQLRNAFKQVEQINDPKKRGRDFEGWLHRLFLHCGLKAERSYTIPHEQIDGAFEYAGRHFLVEAKWHNKPVDFKEIQNFSIKVGHKLTNTVGIFISISGYPYNVADSLSRHHDRNVILFDRDDIESVLSSKLSLTSIIDEKLRAASFSGNLYLKSKVIAHQLLTETIDHISIATEILSSQVQKLEKKYDKDLYVRRRLEQVLINAINNRPKKSKKNIFALIDRAGAGKTNVLCSIAQTLAKKNVVLFFLGNLPVGKDDRLIDFINRYLELSFDRRGLRSSTSAFWDTLRYRAQTEGIKCYIIIDGINESRNIEAIANDLEFLATTFLDYEWLTILVSCRDIYWEYFEKNEPLMTLCNDPIKGELYEFEDKEFLRALPIYFDKYQIEVTLTGDAYTKCKHPLLLRFFCEAHRGRSLNVLDNIRLIDLFDLYWKRKTQAIAKTIPTHRHAEREVNSFLHKVARIMFDNNNRFIPVSLLGTLIHTTHHNETLSNIDDINSLYSRILNEDIILEEVRPGESINLYKGKEPKEHIYCTFVYEEFMEYVIAYSLEKDLRDLTDSEIIKTIESLFDQRKSFINILGIMLYLASLIKQTRNLNIWSILCEKGPEWRKALLDAINKCPEELIDYEFIILLKHISENVRNQIRTVILPEWEENDLDFEVSPVLFIQGLGHRKFYRFRDDIVNILETFLRIDDINLQNMAILELGNIQTEKASVALLNHLLRLPPFDKESKLSILRQVLKNKNKDAIALLLDNLPTIWDNDVSQFFKTHSALVRHNLSLSKKEYDAIIKRLG